MTIAFNVSAAVPTGERKAREIHSLRLIDQVEENPALLGVLSPSAKLLTCYFRFGSSRLCTCLSTNGEEVFKLLLHN